MQWFVNGGIYDIDLDGKSNSEFCYSHPSIIIQSRKEKDMYFIIPLTSYNKNNWENDKKNFCCRILSTNSIALIDKVQVRHKRSIRAKFLTKQNQKMMIITPHELNRVLTKLVMYIKASTDQTQKEYKEYYRQYTLFDKQCQTFFSAVPFRSTDFFEFDDSLSTVSFSCIEIDKLHIKDIVQTIKNYLKEPCEIDFISNNTFCKIAIK
jgi:hypothetical protein